MSETCQLAPGSARRSLKISYSIVAFLFLAANPRPALTSVGPALEAIRSSLGLAFALIGMRTRDHRRAAFLSTMAQTTAYLIAAIGPTAFGWLHDLTIGWTGPMASLVAVSVMQSVMSFGVGRDGQA